MTQRRTPPAPTARPAGPDERLYRQIERKRRWLQRAITSLDLPSSILPAPLLASITHSSFHLESLSVSEAEILAALSPNADNRSFRPRQLLRIRNHVAILRSIERSGRNKSPLKAAAIVRWYTSLSCGLSSPVADSRLSRIELILRRINSPHLRIQHAIPDIAALHCELLADPLFPGFNGVLSRLLLQYHLSRCHLPLVAFDSTPSSQPSSFTPRLIHRILQSYDLLLASLRP